MIALKTKKKTAVDSNKIPLADLSSRSMLMQDIHKKIYSIASLEKHVIIIGEFGSGKKRLASAIHSYSSRNNGPFHSFYCMDIDETDYKEAFWEHLHFEDEHIILKYDVLEKASGGTLYLDQFSEMSRSFMLNIIDSYIRGCNQLFKYNMVASPRLVLSVNQDSYQKMQNTETWKKLLSLLDPIAIMLPPLRERKEDIPELIEVFLEEIRDIGSTWKDVSISEEAINDCYRYSWPGNIRQLKNAILQGAILSHGQSIESHHLPFSMSWKLPYNLEKNRVW